MTIVEFTSKIVMRTTGDLVARRDNPRTHSKKQLKSIVESIRRFGFTNPVLIDADSFIVAGHARVEAAKQVGLKQVPTISLAHLSKAELKAYVITDNRTAELAGWDRELLALNFADIELLDPDFDLTLTGFDDIEIEHLCDAGGTKRLPVELPIPEPRPNLPPVSQLGDVWLIGDNHRLVCGDACKRDAYRQLLETERADLIFTDPPYNVKIAGHVSGLGKVRHREFVAASGELSRSGFQLFMADFMREVVHASRSGSVHYICMDWRHIGDLLAVGESIYDQLLNLVVWAKTNGGMGSFYRSQHELVAVFKHGRRAHLNNVALGSNGRHRANVWNYAGANSFGAQRDEDLALHPTVKPLAMVADAIRDATQHRDIVLDPFGGSGTTLLAAHETGRRARLIELDPLYVDVIIRRAEASGLVARHRETGESFATLAERRLETAHAAALEKEACHA